MKQTITIEPLWCNAIIGIYPHERENAQPICIRVSVGINAADAIAHDRITETLDYDSLAQMIVNHAEGHAYQLLEKLLAQLIEEITRFERVLSIELEISKPKALEQMGATVSVSGSWSREKAA